MDVKDLKYYVTVVEAGSFSSASRLLHVTQPALSWSIKQLEEELGIQLLERYNHGIEMTPSGQILYEGSKEVLENFARLERSLKTETELYRREIRFGLTTLSSINYMDAFECFRKKYKQYDLIFVQRGSKEIQSMLIQGEIDMALISQPVYFPKLETNANYLKGYYYDVGVVVSHRNPLFNRTELTLEDLKDCEFSMVTKDYAVGNEIPNRCRKLGFEPNIVYQNENWEVVVEHVAAYDSVSVLPYEFSNVLKRNDIKWIKLKDHDISRFYLQLVTTFDLNNKPEHLLYWRVYNELMAFSQNPLDHYI